MPKIEGAMDVPDEYLREIGLVVVCFNSLEFLLHSALILALLCDGDLDSNGRANSVVAAMGFDQKLNALESILRLADKTPPETKHPFRAVRTLLEQAGVKRNIVSHHMWSAAGGNVHKSDVQVRKGMLNLVLDPVPLEELAAVALFISDARDALRKFCMARFFPNSEVSPEGK